MNNPIRSLSHRTTFSSLPSGIFNSWDSLLAKIKLVAVLAGVIGLGSTALGFYWDNSTQLQLNSTMGGGYMFDCRIVDANGSGKALAVWHQEGNTFNFNGIMSSLYTPGSGWNSAGAGGFSDPGNLGTSISHDFDVAMNNSGDYVIVGVRSYFTTTSPIVTTQHVLLVSAKVGETTIAANVSTNAGALLFDSEFKTAISGNGDFLIAWENVTANQVRARLYRGGSWQPEVVLSSTDVRTMDVAADEYGNFIVVWNPDEIGAEVKKIYGCRFVGGSWQSVELIGESEGGADDGYPRVGMFGIGGAMVAWWHSFATYNGIAARRFDGSSWLPRETLDTGASTKAAPNIAVQPDGKAVAVFMKGTTTYNIYANNFVNGVWSGPVQIDCTNTGALLSVDMDGYGNAVAAFQVGSYFCWQAYQEGLGWLGCSAQAAARQASGTIQGLIERDKKIVLTPHEIIGIYKTSGDTILRAGHGLKDIRINGFATETATPVVNLEVKLPYNSICGTNSPWLYQQMRFSNDGTHWSPWEPAPTTSPYTATKTGWDLTNPTYGGTASAGMKRVYIQFQNANCTSLVTHDEIILLAGPTLALITATLTQSCTAGQDAGSQSFDVWNSGGGTLSYTISENINWLSCSPASGTSTGEHDAITINYTTSGLTPGTYNGTITVTAAGASGSPQNINVTLTVVAGPQLSVSPTTLTPSCTVGQNAASQSFDIWNSGAQTLSYTISESLSWLSCTPTSGTSTGEHDAITVNYPTSGLTAGTYTGNITVTAAGAAGSPQTITVTLTVIPPAQLSVSPTTLTSSCVAGQNAASQSFDVWNSGGGTLDYTLSEGITWLSCTPISGSSSGEHDIITVNYTTAGLPAGNYTGTITITAPGAGGSPQTVTVSITVTPPPQLSVSPTALNPSCTPGQNAPSQSFEVWNSGGQTLDYLISDNVDWLSCAPASGTSAGGHNTIQVNYTTAGLAEGTHTGTITVAAAEVNGSPQVISVTLTVTRIPQLAVNPMSLSPFCFAGQNAASQTFEVWNSGGQALSYTINENIDWLSCTPTDGTSTGEHDTITLNYATSNLLAGTYLGTITLEAPGAGGSPQIISVRLLVNTPMVCSLKISPSNTFVTSWAGGPGKWLEKSTRLDGSDWVRVPDSEGASQMETPMTNTCAFFRVVSIIQNNAITHQPLSLAVAQGDPATFSVIATGAPSITYQWRLNGANISGANSSIHTIGTVQPSHVGEYSVAVSFGGFESITSSPAALVITSPSSHLVRIPSGTFIMGSPAAEADRDADEAPQTTVSFSKSFWMGAYEVTQQEYIDLVGNNPSYFTNSLSQPVAFLSWDAASNYCRLLTQQERNNGHIPASYQYRLPTEAEWEYACRAGTTTRFSYGDDLGYANLGVYAWYADNSGDTVHPVGGKLPNPWGLFDMYGNVWEFCQDWYSPYSGGSVTDPVGPTTGTMRVLRGSSYYYAAKPCRSANRGAMEAGGMRWDVGFRVVLAAN